MITFQPVHCPIDGSVVMEIATGLSRGKCRQCKRRVWASSDGHDIHIGMVDSPVRQLKQTVRAVVA